MDADAYPQEVLADEEPKYLRRQKPLEIKRRKFGRKAWKTYLRVTFGVGVGIAGACVAYACGHFLFASPQMALLHSSQVELAGNNYVSRGSVLAIFKQDQGRSVLRIPLTERRRQLEAIPWVEQAIVRRALPNNIEVEITERIPIAFLRQGSDLGLVDIHGVMLERPLKANFHFPVVTGIREDMTPDERERRMQLFAGFTQQVESARAHAMEQVSEVDLSDASDLRASIAGLNGDSGSNGGASNPAWDNAAGRQVWHNFWETRLTYERSYLARLNYVHQNAVRHGLVRVANQYRWCSADWLERTATPAQMKTVYSFKIDKLNVLDDFEVLAPVD